MAKMVHLIPVVGLNALIIPYVGCDVAHLFLCVCLKWEKVAQSMTFLMILLRRKKFLAVYSLT